MTPGIPSPRALLAGLLALAFIYLAFLEPWGHDTWFHLQRLQDIEDQLAGGRWHLHFASNGAQDMGLPVWIYYSQWAYWPALPLRAAGLSPLISLKLVYAAMLLVACAGCYRLLRLEVPAETATFGTLLFLTSNFVIGEVFQRSAYAEFMSVALLPFLFLAVHRSLTQSGLGAPIGVSILAALMILFHPLSFMNAGWALVAYALYTLLGRRLPWSRLLRLVPPFALGLGLAAFYWLPAVVETRYVLGAAGVPTPVQETFMTLGKYFNFSGIRSLGLTLTLVLPLLLFGLWRARRAPGRRPVWPIFAALLVYVFLTLRISQPLYDNIALLASNLWVWRVLYPMTLLVVILVVTHLELLPAWLTNERGRAALAGLAILQAAAMVLWNTAHELSLRRFPMAEHEATLAETRQWLEGWGIDEYLPNPLRAPPAPDECGEPLELAAPGRYDFSVRLDEMQAAACLRFPRYWNVRYSAAIDGEPVPLYLGRDAMMTVVPAGRTGMLEVEFTRPAYVRAGALVSALALVLLIAGLARARRAGSAFAPA